MSRLSSAQTAHDFIMALSEGMADPTVPSQQILLLTALYLHGDVNQGELEELTGVKRSSNSRNISKLGDGEVFGSGPQYIESYEDKHNRRMKRVRLTPKGRALMDSALDRAEGVKTKGGSRASTPAVQT